MRKMLIDACKEGETYIVEANSLGHTSYYKEGLSKDEMLKKVEYLKRKYKDYEVRISIRD